MQDYILAAIGIGVSLLLFLVSYRKTVGAARERVRAANGALERVLLRRIVQENYTPRSAEVAELIEGLARDHNVKPATLLTPLQVMNTLYTRIVESDLIATQQRTLLLDRIRLGTPQDADRISEAQLQAVRVRASAVHRATQYTAILAVLASIFGTVVPLIGLGVFDSSVARWPAPFLAFTLSLAAALMAGAYLSFRDRAAGSEPDDAAKRELSFEDEVSKRLTKAGIPALVSRFPGYDFAIDWRGKRVLIELKAWDRRMPISIVKRTIRYLKSAMNQTGADEGWIVLKNRDAAPRAIADEGVRVLTLAGLRALLAQGRNS